MKLLWILCECKNFDYCVENNYNPTTQSNITISIFHLLLTVYLSLCVWLCTYLSLRSFTARTSLENSSWITIDFFRSSQIKTTGDKIHLTSIKSTVDQVFIFTYCYQNLSKIINQNEININYDFFCVGVMYSGEYDACDVTLSVYPHRASLKNMPDHGGNRTYDLWNKL
jgi:hypothetical protein